MKGSVWKTSTAILLLIVVILSWKVYQGSTRFRTHAEFLASTVAAHIYGASQDLGEIADPSAPAAHETIRRAAQELQGAYDGVIDLSQFLFVNRTEMNGLGLLESMLSAAEADLNTMAEDKDYRRFGEVKSRLASLSATMPQFGGPDYLKRFDNAMAVLVNRPRAQQ